MTAETSGKERRGRKKALTETQEALIVEAWLAGEHVMELAARFGVSMPTIYKAVRDPEGGGALPRNRLRVADGKEPSTPRVRQPAWQQEARLLYESERRYTLQELGDMFGISRERVRQVAFSQGWVRHERALTRTQRKQQQVRQRRAARVWRFVEIPSLDACWNWTGNIGGNGTPRVGYTDPAIGIRRNISARAYLYHLCREPLDLSEGYLRGQGNFQFAILPTCGYMPCVNPWHCRPFSKAEISSITMSNYWNSEIGDDRDPLDYDLVPSALRPARPDQR